MLRNILKFEFTIHHIIFVFMGIKFSIRHPYRKYITMRFLKHNIKSNTILLVEINDCHRETLPGYVKYLWDLGYEVEVLVNCCDEGVFCRFDSKLKVWKFYEKEFCKVLQHEIMEKYKCVIFNSKIIYQKKLTDIHEYLPNLKSGNLPNIYIQHHIDKYFDNLVDKQLILANPMVHPELLGCVVNPHYFGNVKITFKNEMTNFIVVGGLDSKRRSSDLLINSVKQMHNLGVKNFKVTIIGNGNIDNIPYELRKYFIMKGRLSFPKMYQEMERADFFLPLLDPENKEHDRYITCGTSGSFQLIYGFCKPCIINKKFADVYEFDKTNSIVYVQNSDFTMAMNMAINMTKDKYLYLQKNLLVHSKKIYEISKNNLRVKIDDKCICNNCDL